MTNMKIDEGIEYTGAKKEVFYNPDEDSLTFAHKVDYAPTLDFNKRMQNETSGYTPSKDMKMVASFPPEWCYFHEDRLGKPRGWLLTNDGWDTLKRLLNDPDNKFLRTSVGNI